MRHKIWIFGALVFLALLLTGCAGGERPQANGSGSTIGVVYRTPS